MSPEFAVAVDLTNPGQYFACCGLLELAHRMWPGAEGWFDGGLFRVRAEGTAVELVEALRTCEIDNTMTVEQKRRREELGAMGSKALKADSALEEEKKALDGLWRESPVVFGAPFHLRVDWFLDDRSGGAALKTWGGQQSILATVKNLRALLPKAHGTEWFDPYPPSKSVPLYFDSDIGATGTDIDAGFSFDPLKEKAKLRVGMRPTIELLAFIGLQRFRPADRGRVWEYGIWNLQGGVELATLACCRASPRLTTRGFRFRLLYRTDYLKSFLPATAIREEHGDGFQYVVTGRGAGGPDDSRTPDAGGRTGRSALPGDVCRQRRQDIQGRV